ncbi:GSCOCT00013210001.2-RA-CDS [Cotesia congregata]|uniref:Cc_ptp.y_17.2 n=2 Tax=root TaxID=1 RepID=S6CWM3_COTCN|nr:protein-tyrosine phosphatase [Bracoviriform congregatae]CAD6244017.1 GSCOCT00013210001.2-RA-CDS [Cotesia congregata]CAG17456.1 protein-tyrosine phosphatase [Bracoviriform congregatae]CAG26744.1 protein tyrosine phosphatase [Bracoviriform congregatae]CAG5075835.1 cc_ptp.y_17.2 [Cotesia congregata]CCQ71294.1 protein tyrosine phosphatase PTPY [Cotesia congregata]
MGSGNSKSLKCNNLIKLFNKPNALQYLCEEHHKILNSETQGTFDVCTSEENFRKNRYPDKPCFDHSRVILSEGNCSDYINASHVDGFKHPNKFIVSQAPLEETVSDWWKMIWEQKCELIVMLCKLVESGRSQCYRYWSPVEGTTLEIGSLMVKTIEVSSVFRNFQITRIDVTHKERGSLRLTHFLYEKWQEDYTFPEETDFLHLVLMIKTHYRWLVNRKLDNGYRTHSKGPIVVHCNSGLERAMTFCAVDIALSSFVKTCKFNLYSIVTNLRKQRYNCLSDVNQYVFCYAVLLCYVELYLSY